MAREWLLLRRHFEELSGMRLIMSDKSLSVEKEGPVFRQKL